MKRDVLRFGILGTGNIANQFAEGVADARRCTIHAVASRQPDRASTFAKAHEIPNAYGTYDELLNDPAVDAVYISLPNTMHHAWTLKALNAGKHVLCEKPLACTYAEAHEMFDAARQQRRILVEAFMYRSHPQTRLLRQELERGTIGQVKLIRASFCYCTRKIEGNIRFVPELAGGALMDIGCYCVDLARLVTGAEPSAMHASSQRHPAEVDEYVCGTLKYEQGVLAQFCCGMTVQTDNAALICGDEGYLRIPVPWKPPVSGAMIEVGRMTPPRQDGQARTESGTRMIEVPPCGALYGLEADDFAAVVLDGRPPAMPEEDSLANMRVLEALRAMV